MSDSNVRGRQTCHRNVWAVGRVEAEPLLPLLATLTYDAHSVVARLEAGEMVPRSYGSAAVVLQKSS